MTKEEDWKFLKKSPGCTCDLSISQLQESIQRKAEDAILLLLKATSKLSFSEIDQDQSRTCNESKFS